MTEIRSGSPVKRETSRIHRGGMLVIAAHPGYVAIRQKGRRHSFTVDWAAIYDLGARQAAEAARAAKRSEKKGRRP